MLYDEKIIDQVQSANDIADIIGQFVPLKKSGHNFKGLCPFHSEKTPSFMVHPEKQIFHCFGCGVGGNVFSFLMKYENMSFPEALRQLAERAHIRLPEPTQDRKKGEPSENERMLEAYRLAAEYYHAALLDSATGREAKAYYLKRGFDPALVREFQIGWAPDAWRGLLEFLGKKGFSDTLLLKAALIQKSPKGPLYDTFRNRLMFPIRNLQGKVIAFGGRWIIDQKEGPKYLNSSETPIFRKRKELFGLHIAKKHIDSVHPRIYVVEGYFDFLRLYQCGFKSTVATLGTALTDEHVQLLKRFAQEAIVIYDGDKAGEAASLRGLEVFLEGGMNVKIARMPSGDDPDDFLRKHKPEDFQKLLNEARDFFDYKLEILLGRFNRWDSLGLMQITNEFLETFVKVKNPILLDRYLRQLAGALGVEENSLRRELMKLTQKLEKNVKPESSSGKNNFPEAVSDEILLLGSVLEKPGLIESILQQISESDFELSEARELYYILRNLFGAGEKISWSLILNRLENEGFKQKLTAVTALELSEEQIQKAIQDCIERIQKKNIGRQLEDLRRRIAKAEREGNQAEVHQFAREYQELLKQNKPVTH